MRDQYGRKIEYMRISVTDRCNLRCVYCMPAEGVPYVPHSDILTFDEIERVCRAGAGLGISRIKLTGGEPLVRRGLPELLGNIKRIRGIEQVTLTTNGILLEDQIEELVSKGLDSVNISIDTLDEERYEKITRGGKLKQALAGLDAALQYTGLRVKVNCVPLARTESVRDRDRECVRLASLAKNRRLEVRFIEMMPIGRGKEFAGIGQDKILAILEDEFGKAERYRGRLGNGPAVYVHFSGFKGRIGFISAVSHQFCDSCNRVRLTSEGYLKLCLQYERGTDLRSLLRAGADDKALEAAMRDAVYRKPACHHFTEKPADGIEKKGMSSIGG